MDFAYTPEQEELIRTLRTFARKELAPRSQQWDRTGALPWDAWRQMGELGLLGLRAPAAYGGQDADLVTMGIATEEIARGDFSCTYGIQLANLAGEILGYHHLDETPCSERSPVGLLARHDGWILMMGTTMDSCTLIHHVEEMIAPDLYLRPAAQRETYFCHDRHGREVTVHLRRHLRLPRDFWQFQDMLAAQGELRLARVDNSVCRAFRAGALVRLVTETLTRRPDAIIARPGQRYRMM